MERNNRLHFMHALDNYKYTIRGHEITDHTCNTVMNELDKTSETCVTRFVEFCHHILL